MFDKKIIWFVSWSTNHRQSLDQDPSTKKYCYPTVVNVNATNVPPDFLRVDRFPVSWLLICSYCQDLGRTILNVPFSSLISVLISILVSSYLFSSILRRLDDLSFGESTSLGISGVFISNNDRGRIGSSFLTFAVLKKSLSGVIALVL